jgi:hypothetical protein
LSSSSGAVSSCLLLLLIGCAGKAVLDDGSATGGHGAGASSGSAGAGLCVRCDAVLNLTDWPQICPGPERDAYEALLACGCSGGCPECTNYLNQKFCIGGYADSSCVHCMDLLCPAEIAACEGETE